MISIIVATGQNNAIGCHNKLLWHIPEDLKRFKALTTGHAMVMGRKTYDSIGRPLPNRKNIVVSRQEGLNIDGVEVYSTLEAALEAAGEDAFVIGGEQIYRQTMSLAQKLYVTAVDQTHEADAFFPEINPDEWREVAREAREGYSFVDYVRV